MEVQSGFYATAAIRFQTVQRSKPFENDLIQEQDPNDRWNG